MNLISFTNFFDNHTSFLLSAEKDGRTEDFSSILQSICFALQTANSPVMNFSGGFEQIQTVSDGGQNFVVGNNWALSENILNQNPNLLPNLEKTVSFKTILNHPILPTIPDLEEISQVTAFKPDAINPTVNSESAISFAPTENLTSISTNFQAALQMPTREVFSAQNTVTPQNIVSENQSLPVRILENQPLPVESPFETKNFEISPDFEKITSPLSQNPTSVMPTKSEPNINLLHVFRNVRDLIRENDLPKEISLKTVLPESNFATTDEAKRADLPALKTEIAAETKIPLSNLSLTQIISQNSEAKTRLNFEQTPKAEPVLPPQQNAEIQPKPNNPLPKSPTIDFASPKSNTEVNLESQPMIEPKLNSDLQPKTDLALEPPKSLNLEKTLEVNLNLETAIKPDLPLKEPEVKPDLAINQTEKKSGLTVNQREIKPGFPVNKIRENLDLLPTDSDFTIEFTKDYLNNTGLEIQTNFPNTKSAEIVITEPQAEPVLVKETFTARPMFEIPKSDSVNEVPQPNLAAKTSKPVSTDNQAIAINSPIEDFSQPVLVEEKLTDSVLPNPTNIKLTEVTLPPVESVNKRSTDLNLDDDEISGLLDGFAEKINVSAADKSKLGNYLNGSEQNELPNISTKNEVKIENGEMIFSPKSEKENKAKDVENYLPVTFEKIIENAAKPLETTLKNQVEASKITEQINPHLLELAALVEKKNEKEILKLRLHPAELGTVEITLEKNSSGVLNAHFKTETADAQQALSKGLEQLRDNLQNSGWEIGKMEISNGSTSTTDNNHRQQNQSKTESRENFTFNQSSEQLDETENSSPKRLLNLLA